jgi:hypothetical protein
MYEFLTLYEAWGKPEKVAEYRAILDEKAGSPGARFMAK